MLFGSNILFTELPESAFSKYVRTVLQHVTEISGSLKNGILNPRIQDFGVYG